MESLQTTPVEDSSQSTRGFDGNTSENSLPPTTKRHSTRIVVYEENSHATLLLAETSYPCRLVDESIGGFRVELQGDALVSCDSAAKIQTHLGLFEVQIVKLSHEGGKQIVGLKRLSDELAEDTDVPTTFGGFRDVGRKLATGQFWAGVSVVAFLCVCLLGIPLYLGTFGNLAGTKKASASNNSQVVGKMLTLFGGEFQDVQQSNQTQLEVAQTAALAYKKLLAETLPKYSRLLTGEGNLTAGMAPEQYEQVSKLWKQTMVELNLLNQSFALDPQERLKRTEELLAGLDKKVKEIVGPTRAKLLDTKESSTGTSPPKTNTRP